MGLFSPKGQKITAAEYIEKYGIGGLSNQDIVKKIAEDLADSQLTKDTMEKGKINAPLFGQLTFLDTIVEQNWLILKQLEQLNRNYKEANK